MNDSIFLEIDIDKKYINKLISKDKKLSINNILIDCSIDYMKDIVVIKSIFNKNIFSNIDDICRELVNSYKEKINVYLLTKDLDSLCHYFYKDNSIFIMSVIEEKLKFCNDDEKKNLIKMNPFIYKYLSDEEKANPRFVNSYSQLCFMPENLKNDICFLNSCFSYFPSLENFYLYLITRNESYKYDEEDYDDYVDSNSVVSDEEKNMYFDVIPDELMSNKRFVLTLFSIYKDWNKVYKKCKLKNNYDILKLYFSYSKCDVDYCDLEDEVKNNFELMLMYFKNNPSKLIKSPYYDSSYYITKLLFEDCDCLEFVSDRLKDDYDISLSSVRKYPFSIVHVSERLRNDKDFVEKALCNVSNTDLIKIKQLNICNMENVLIKKDNFLDMMSDIVEVQ